ncbi:MAG: hypothetical protein WD801_05990 [Gemmatimonadaceae bacterium]
MLVAFLTLALLAPVERQATSQPDSVAVRRFIAHARREEAKFLAAWRREWQAWRDLGRTDPRYFSLHCHFDEPLFARERFHLIRTPYSRKSMCPIWFQGRGERADEAAGIDNGIRPRSREKIRERRAAVLQLLDSAAVLAHGDLWVLGQRVRLHVDQGNHERALAIASSECGVPGATCAMLEGYVLASGGHRRAAEATFGYATSRMTDADRCRYLDIAAFVPWGQRDRYGETSCDERSAANENFWWLADPLFAEPGNERLAVHLFRYMIVALRSALTADEHFDWRLGYGGAAAAEMILRYGWPNVSYYDRQEDESHNRWLGWRDSASNSSREYFWPRYQSAPTWDVARDLSTLRAEVFANVTAPWDGKALRFDPSWWPVEHFNRAGPLISLDYQMAVFRRERAPLVALATDPRTRGIDDSMLAAYSAVVVAMRGPRDTPRRSEHPARIRDGGSIVMTLETEPGWQVLSGELMQGGNDAAAAARTRFPATIAPGLDSLRAGEVALSDPALFAMGISDSLPQSSSEAIDRMLPTTNLRAPERLGVYFEIYGLPPDATGDLTLTIVSLDQPGLLRRLGARFGVAESAGGAISVRWQGNHPGAASSLEQVGTSTIHTRSIVLNVALLRSGRYSLEIGVERAGGEPVLARRELSIAR